MDTQDALGAYNFGCEIDGVLIAQFKEASGLSTEIKVIEHEEVLASGQPIIKMIPGPRKWEAIVLKRGKTEDHGWWEWIDSVHSGDITSARRNGSIILFAYDRTERARYNFLNAWPSKVNISGLKADGAEVIIEEVTLVHEGLEFK